MRTTLSICTITTGLLVGCGASNTPEISDLVIATSPVVRGQQATGSFTIKDLDGLGDMTLSGRLFGPVEGIVPITAVGLSDALTEASVTFGLVLTTQAPAGEYTMKITAEDPDTNKSNEASVAFTAQ
jgi:hypothetical protein